MSTTTADYRAWQKTCNLKDKLDGLHEWFKSNNIEEAVDIKEALDSLKAAAEGLAKRILDRSRK